MNDSIFPTSVVTSPIMGGPNIAVGPVEGDSLTPMSSNEGTLSVDGALTYLEYVKTVFSSSSDEYNKLEDILKDLRHQSIDFNDVIQRVTILFAEYPGLIEGFNTFLPPGYPATYTTPSYNASTSSDFPSNAMSSNLTSAICEGSSSSTELQADSIQYTRDMMRHTMEYVMQVKLWFAFRDDLYQEFLNILRAVHDPHVDQKQLSLRIADLFQGSPHLLSGLQYFIPREVVNLDTIAVGERIRSMNIHGSVEAD
ncbi:hypothetical protein ACEPAF_2309 [Sanghuangporus sanghuang]